jgi:hypothetical protein
MEKHFKADVMDAIEFELYRNTLRNMSEDDLSFLFNILKGTNIITGMHGCRAKVKATRMSGEMNTSLGNGWSNYVVFDYIVSNKGGHWEGYVEGDDGIFVTDVEVTTEDYNALGFDVKIKEHDTTTTASFCGIIASSDGTLIKDPRKVFETFGWTSSFINAGESIMMELLRAKALSLAYECGACPILWTLAQEALKFTRNYEPRFIVDWYHKEVPNDEANAPIYEPTAAARSKMAQVFDIPVGIQLEVEDAIRRNDMNKVFQLLPSTLEMQHYCSCYVAIG